VVFDEDAVVFFGALHVVDVVVVFCKMFVVLFVCCEVWEVD